MRSRLSAIALATALALPGAAQAYSNFYFFGDSLTDIGAFGGLGGLPQGARWTLGYGQGWSQDLAGYYGIAVTANNPNNAANTSATGNNYAQGGAQAQTVTDPSHKEPSDLADNPTPDAIPIADLLAQTASYLKQSGGKADGNAVYSVWIGGNDAIAAAGKAGVAYQTAYATALGSGQTQAQAQAAAQTAATKAGTAYLTTSATATAQSIGMLQQAGAKLILAPNLPDISNAPLSVLATLESAQSAGSLTAAQFQQAWGAAWLALSGGATNSSSALSIQALHAAALKVGLPATAFDNTYALTQSSLQSLAAGYNQLTDLALAQGGLQHGVIRADIAGLFHEILANPTAYGFTNTSGSACPWSAIRCNTAQVPGQNYMFTDALHPTPYTYQLVAAYDYSLLQAPYFALALPQNALNSSRQLGEALNGRYQAIRAQKRDVGQISAFVDGAYNDNKTNLGTLTAKPKGQLYTLGLDYQATPALSLGVALSRQVGKTDVDIPGAQGQAQDGSTLFTGLVSYNAGSFWVDGDAHVGDGNLDTTRQVVIGPMRLNISGTTRQTQYGARVAGGYRIPLAGFSTGPVGSVDYAHATIAGYSEQGGNSASLHFDKQSVSSTVGRVGWQIEGDIGRVSPYAKVSYAHEFNQDAPSVTTNLVSTFGDFTVSGSKPGANWVEWNVGLTANFSKQFAMWGALTATSGRSSGNQAGGNIGLAYTF